MEIRNYFRMIRKFIWWLVVPLISVLILTLILSLIYKESYQSTVTLAINRKSQQKETLDYQFDSYYAIQANDMLAKQFTEWLKGGSVVPSIYLRAGLKEENALLIKEWKVTNHSPQDIEIVLRGRDKDRVSTLAKAAAATVDEKKEEFTGSGEAAIGTVTVPSEVIVITKNTLLTLNLLVGLLAGLLVGLIFVYFKAIFSTDQVSKISN